MFKIFTKFNWKLFIAIFLSLIIPLVYRTTRIHFIGTLPNSYSFSIAGNLEWINVAFEVLEESFLLPFFFILSRLAVKKHKLWKRKISYLILLISFIYLIFILILFFNTKSIAKFMNAQKLTSQSVSFIRIELFGRLFVMMAKISILLLLAKKVWLDILILIFINTTINILLDLFIASNNKLSMKGGILWIAYDQLITSCFVTFIGFILIIIRYEYKKRDLIPKLFWEWKLYSQNIYSGLESFVRNAFFIWFVIKVVNRLGSGYNQGDFWVMNNLIWGWMLLPILSIGQYLNRLEAFDEKKLSLKEKLTCPLLLITFSAFMWLALMPTYSGFVKNVLNNPDYELISKLARISIGFYVLFAYGEPLSKGLYGKGYHFWFC